MNDVNAKVGQNGEFAISVRYALRSDSDARWKIEC